MEEFSYEKEFVNTSNRLCVRSESKITAGHRLSFRQSPILKFWNWEIGRLLPARSIFKYSVFKLIDVYYRISTLKKFPNFPIPKFQNRYPFLHLYFLDNRPDFVKFALS